MVSDLDIEAPGALERYLRDSARIGPEETIQTRLLAGGVSNRTVLVQREDGQAWVIKQALGKLRVAIDWFSSPERIEREALGMRWLVQLAPSGTIPNLIFEDPAHHLLAMEAIAEPHDVWKDRLLAGKVDERHFVQFGHLLGTIHRAAYERREELQAAFADHSFFESLRVEPFYAYTAAHLPETAPFFAKLISETRERRITLVHGDYSPKNILIRQDRLILLDHEVIHFGDPAFDVGFSLAHLLSKANHLAAHREALASVSLRYWDIYEALLADVPWRAELQARCTGHALGCLLARVEGKSRLEYLSPSERSAQSSIVRDLMRAPPPTIHDLVTKFIELLETRNRK